MRLRTQSLALVGSACQRMPGRIAAVIACCAVAVQGVIAVGQPASVLPLPPVEAPQLVRALPLVESAPAPGSPAPLDPEPAVATPLQEDLDRVFSPTTYAIAELLIFQRDNQANDVPLVTDTLTANTVLSVGDLNPGMAYGARAFLGVRRRDALGFEAGYLGVYGMQASRTVTGSESLQLAGPLSSLVPLPYGAADQAQATYSSSFQSVEVNAFSSCCSERSCHGSGCDAAACGDSCCIDWLGGIRYANLAEQAGLLFTCCTNEPVGPFSSSYDVQTTNNLVGGQFGGRASKTWRAWAVEGWAKAGVFANIQSQSQAPIIDPIDPGTPARTARSATGVEPAMMADLNLSVIYRLTEVWGLRMGYNALWAGNVALAPNQWDFGTSADSGTGLSGNGGLFLNGVNIGLDACW